MIDKVILTYITIFYISFSVKHNIFGINFDSNNEFRTLI